MHTHTVTEMPRFGGDWGCVQRGGRENTNFPLVFHYLLEKCGVVMVVLVVPVWGVCGIGDKPKLNGHSH